QPSIPGMARVERDGQRVQLAGEAESLLAGRSSLGAGPLEGEEVDMINGSCGEVVMVCLPAVAGRRAPRVRRRWASPAPARGGSVPSHLGGPDWSRFPRETYRFGSRERVTG